MSALIKIPARGGAGGGNADGMSLTDGAVVAHTMTRTRAHPSRRTSGRWMAGPPFPGIRPNFPAATPHQRVAAALSDEIEFARSLAGDAAASEAARSRLGAANTQQTGLLSGTAQRAGRCCAFTANPQDKHG